MISWDFPSYQYQRCLVIALRIHHVAFSRMSETWILTVGSQVDRPITAWWTVLIFTTSSWLLVEGLSHVLFMFHCFRDDPQWQAYFLWGFKKKPTLVCFLIPHMWLVKSHVSPPDAWQNLFVLTKTTLSSHEILWMEEILHQLVDGLSPYNPIISSVS